MKTSLLVISILILALAACSPASSSATTTSNIQIDQAVVPLPGGVMPDMNANGSLAGYLRIKNSSASDDNLTGVQANFAGMSMLHKTSIDSNGVAKMEMVVSIKVPAGQTVELKPGDFHIMFTDLKNNLKVGNTVTLILQFEKAGLVMVLAQVVSQ